MTTPDPGSSSEPIAQANVPSATRGHFAIAAGAIIGVCARFMVGELAARYLPATLPLGTLLVNLSGCLLIGIVQVIALELKAMRQELQLFLAVGVLGGFTTFSTFSVETVRLVQTGHAAQALCYQALSLIGGVGAVGMGIMGTYTGRRWIERGRQRA
jgi:CrcB protein